MPDKIYVVAGNRAQYEQWCRSMQLNPHDRKVVEYVSSPLAIRGVTARLDQFEYVGTWNCRPDAQRILSNVEFCNAAASKGKKK